MVNEKEYYKTSFLKKIVVVLFFYLDEKVQRVKSGGCFFNLWLKNVKKLIENF